MATLAYKNVSRLLDIFPSDYVVLDLETTGLSGINDRIIEISLLKYHQNCLQDRLVTLVNPGMMIPNGIVRLTGISNEMVVNSPSIIDLIPDIMTFIGKSTIIGHNVNFDLRFLKQAYQLLDNNQDEIEYHYIDTLSLSRLLIHDTKNHRLETMKNYLQIEIISHRAEQDCLVTHLLYQYCKRLWNEQTDSSFLLNCKKK